MIFVAQQRIIYDNNKKHTFMYINYSQIMTLIIPLDNKLLFFYKRVIKIFKNINNVKVRPEICSLIIYCGISISVYAFSIFCFQ
jgi:predicted  nucleic acid-binding Zn-ribbon protein